MLWYAMLSSFRKIPNPVLSLASDILLQYALLEKWIWRGLGRCHGSLKAPADLTEELSSIPSTHMTDHKHM